MVSSIGQPVAVVVVAVVWFESESAEIQFRSECQKVAAVCALSLMQPMQLNPRR